MKKIIISVTLLLVFFLLPFTTGAQDLTPTKNLQKSPPIQTNNPQGAEKAEGIDKNPSNEKNEIGDIARRGCCSWHNGVCGCDESTNRIQCCDGTLSPSCTCSGY
jgi:hypothetical protein